MKVIGINGSARKGGKRRVSRLVHPISLLEAIDVANEPLVVEVKLTLDVAAIHLLEPACINGGANNTIRAYKSKSLKSTLEAGELKVGIGSVYAVAPEVGSLADIELGGEGSRMLQIVGLGGHDRDEKGSLDRPGSKGFVAYEAR